MRQKCTVQDIAIGIKRPYYQVDQIVIAFNSALVRKVVQNGDYQQAVLDIAEYLNEDPGELFLKLDEKLQTVIRSHACK